MEIKLFIATHKKAQLPPDTNLYVPIQVGAENKEDLGYLKDNTGENISSKNPNYCELTALYWMWKNCKSDIVGLVHYRRYFFKSIFSKKYSNLLSKDDIENIMKNYDIILPKKQCIVKYNLEEQWNKIHNKKDLEICRNIIDEKYSDYISAFDNVFNKHSFYAFNMFIAKKEIIDEYCKWLFDILFEIEKRVDISSYDKYNQRIFGFLSERLFNVWLEKNAKDLKIKEQTVFQTEQSVINQNISEFLKKIYIDIFIINKSNNYNILIGLIAFLIGIVFYYIGLNYITSLILIVTGIILFFLNKKIDGYFTNPKGIYSIIWFSTIGLSTLKLHQDQVDWKLLTWIYLGLAYLMFIIGYSIREVKQDKNKKTKIEFIVTKKRFFIFIVMAFLAVIFAFIVEVIIRGYIPMFSDDMASYQNFGVTRYTLFYSKLCINIAY